MLSYEWEMLDENMYMLYTTQKVMQEGCNPGHVNPNQASLKGKGKIWRTYLEGKILNERRWGSG